MILVRQVFTALAVVGLAVTGLPAVAGDYMEPPFLAEQVTAGALPAIADRLPDSPLVATFQGDYQTGEYGGDLRMIMAKQKDIRMMMVYGYGRLVGYDTNLELVPDILASIDVEENRIFTMHLRPGHRWSDGEPFTSEAFRYYWEDMANNETLSPVGPSKALQPDGEAPIVEFIDDLLALLTSRDYSHGEGADGFDQGGREVHLPLIGQLGNILGHIGDGVLAVKDFQHVAPFHGHQEPSGHVAPNLVLEFIGFMFNLVDVRSARLDALAVSLGHGFNEGNDLPRTFNDHGHVLLHGADGRASDQLIDPGHGASYGPSRPLKK